MVNVYDFDETICFKDSTLGFWKYCIKKKPIILICIPLQALSIILYKLGITKDISLFYIFLKFLKEDTKYIQEFCDIQIQNMCKWYIEQKQPTDVIVSASPEFLIKELCGRLGVRYVASQVDYKTGKYSKLPCKGKQKPIQFYEKFKNEIVNKSYGNAKSDIYMIKAGKEGYMVKNQSISEMKIEKIH